MALLFENLTGKVDIKVYDMTGSLIDAVQAYNDRTSNTIQYDMAGHSDGVYLFVATGREGVVTKKVVIQ